MNPIQLPFPPLCATTEETTYRVGEPTLLVLVDGSRLHGFLLAFSTSDARLTLRLETNGRVDIKDFPLSQIRLLRAITRRHMKRTPSTLEDRGKVIIPPAKQEYEVVLETGETLQGNTYGFRLDKNGLHLYPVTEDERYNHMFVPGHAIKSHRVGPLLGNALILDQAVSADAVSTGLSEQQKKRDEPLGEILKASRLVSAADLEAALKRQRSMPQLRLGEVLVKEGMISEAQLQEALQKQQNNRKTPLGEILVSLGLVTAQAVRQTLAKKMGIPFVDLREFQVDQEVVKLIPEDTARKQQVMPLYVQDGRLVFAVENPLNWQAADAIRFCTKLIADPVMASWPDIAWAIDKYYGDLRNAELIEDMDVVETDDDDDADYSVTAGREKPIVRFVDSLLLQATKIGASDIHIRPGSKEVDVLYRIHGELRHQRSIAKTMLPAMVSRIKIMGHMNIAERRRPQDGRIRLRIGERLVDFRVSVIPTVRGESVVIRVLDKSAKLQSLDAIGLSERDLSDFVDLLNRNAGIILVTGATGSGKSSTLYAALQKLVARNLHTISIEEPVEAEIQGVEQIQVNNAAGYTFALALRNILRHDPDAIMVGEIRDQETAKIALESAMTGHLVLSTLHTNDAPSTIGRLLEMGIEPYLLSAALLGVMSQRLVRLNCPECLTPEEAADEMRQRLGVGQDVSFFRSKGCKACEYSGTSGRTLAYEFLRVTPAIRRLINEGRPASDIRECAGSEGMVDLTQQAIQLAKHGRITLEQAYLVKQA
jgi:type IV pilus assembly protein PilB